MSDERVAVVAEGDWVADVDADEGVVINWFAREGGIVAAGETICEIQVEKADIDVVAPVGGILAEIVRGEDEEFAVGETLAWIQPGTS